MKIFSARSWIEPFDAEEGELIMVFSHDPSNVGIPFLGPLNYQNNERWVGRIFLNNPIIRLRPDRKIEIPRVQIDKHLSKGIWPVEIYGTQEGILKVLAKFGLETYREDIESLQRPYEDSLREAFYLDRFGWYYGVSPKIS